MTIDYCIQVGDCLSQEEKSSIEQLIAATFLEIHHIYNNWNPDSEISRLNALPAYQKVPLSKELTSFFATVHHMVILTEGRFDPTIEPFQQLWKQCLRNGHIPSEGQMTELNPAIGWEKVHIENTTFWKEHALTAIDLGGIAKGYAVDLLIEQLLDQGIKNIYVEWGGEIRTAGSHPSGRPWRVGILGSDTLSLRDVAIATSGSYAQNWTIEGVSYTHIFDPHTGQPLQNAVISSVSILAPTCAEADALATALMLFPSLESARLWAQQLPPQYKVVDMY